MTTAILTVTMPLAFNSRPSTIKSRTFFCHSNSACTAQWRKALCQSLPCRLQRASRGNVSLARQPGGVRRVHRRGVPPPEPATASRLTRSRWPLTRTTPSIGAAERSGRAPSPRSLGFARKVSRRASSALDHGRAAAPRYIDDAMASPGSRAALSVFLSPLRRSNAPSPLPQIKQRRRANGKATAMLEHLRATASFTRI